VGRAIVMLAIPMVLEMVMESVFAVVDIFFVARLGPAAVASVGLTESILALVYTVAMGLSIGAMAVVARRVGEGDDEAAAEAALQVLFLGVGMAVLIGIAGALGAPHVLRIMGADEEVIRTGTGYTRVMLGGNATVLLLFLLNAAFRGAGDAALAMRVLWLANTINIILDPCLIFGLGPFPELGVTGAAVATNIGRGTAVCVQIYSLFHGTGRLKASVRHIVVKPALMLRVLRLSGTGMLQVFIGTASWVGLVRLLATFGPDALAGYTVAIRIVLFALLPAWGLSNAAATMVGQGLGAGDPERAERSVWIAGFMNFVFLGVVGLVFVIAAPLIVRLFGSDPETAAYAARCLRIVSAGFVFYAYGMVLQQSFNGAGDAWTPTWLNVLCFWLWEIPLAWVLARKLNFGPDGVFAAITIAFSTLTVISAVLFKQGRWKKAVV
jgi:putative MATE family efflux protein